MKIARFLFRGRPTIAVDGGDGFVDYGAILEACGYDSEFIGSDPDRHIIRMLKRGMWEENFITERLIWARQTGRGFYLNEGDLTPILTHKPSKMICVARNYVAHAHEKGHELPESPVFFTKTDNSIIGPTDPIPVPAGLGRVDHEGELGVVISRLAKRIPAEDCRKFILGYIIVNDVTAREYQHSLAGKGLPWYAAKSLDGFAPIGPWIVTPTEFEPLAKHRIKVRVNGEVRQDGSLKDMNWGVDELIETISRNITLQPGDIIATGTPAGIGPMKPGDKVEVEIDGIGKIENPVIEV